MKKEHKFPRFIYISGCDGTGKSTQARLLVNQLRCGGNRVRHVWLRYPFFFSLPFLLYARLRRLSWFEVHDGQRFGYWDFRASWIMRAIFPWALLIDAFIAACYAIYLPLALGNVIVCERFVIDMLVDLMVGYHDNALAFRKPGSLFTRLLPEDRILIIMELDPKIAIQRRNSLRDDLSLTQKMNAFHIVGVQLGIMLLSSNPPVPDINRQILNCIGGMGEK